MIITEPWARIFEFSITGHLHTWSDTTRTNRKCCPKFFFSLEGDLYREFLSRIANEVELERPVGGVVGQVIEHAWLNPHLVTMELESGDWLEKSVCARYMSDEGVWTANGKAGVNKWYGTVLS